MSSLLGIIPLRGQALGLEHRVQLFHVADRREEVDLLHTRRSGYTGTDGQKIETDSVSKGRQCRVRQNFRALTLRKLARVIVV